MSHELRTPMNAVLGMNELLSRTPLNSLQKNYVAHIRSSATMLLSIINDILDFSQLEDRKMQIAAAPWDCNSLLNDVLNLVSVKIAEKELSFTVDLDPTIPTSLVGDEIRVKQILINLLNNAVKFTDRGEVNLSVTVAGRPAHDEVLLAFRVRDTGIGIPKDKQSELFGRFVRIENPGTTRVEGSGLGLSICRNLVRLMGGSLRMESAEGVGSVFTAEIVQKVAPGSPCLTSFSPPPRASLLVFDADLPTIASIRQMAAAAKVEARLCSRLEEFTDALSAATFPYSHVVFEFRGAYPAAAEASRRRTGVRWLALLTLTDFIGQGKEPGIDFFFKPLVLPTFARFLRGESVDFGGSLPMANSLGMQPLFFRASGVVALVVDDSPVNRKVAEGFLQTFDIKSDEAANGEDALRLAAGKRYDLVFMDHLMPGMDGIAAAQEMRKLPGYARTPIIAMTANLGGSYRDRYLGAGMDDYLVKPIEFTAFTACLRRWIPAERQMPQSGSDAMEAALPGATGAAGAPSPGKAVGDAGEACVVAEPDPGAAASASSVTTVSSGASLLAAEPWIDGLDLAAGIEYTGGRKNLETILKVFARTAPKMLEQLESGRHSGNQAQFRTAAHSLISSMANVGGLGISGRARELEQAILAGQGAEIDRLYPIVHAELETIIAGVAAHLERVAAQNAAK